MANARMCDRCGRCFNPLSETGSMCRFVNPVFQDPEDIKKFKVGARLLHDEPPDAYVDLCPDCTTQFFIFMNPGDTDGDKETKEQPSASPVEILDGCVRDILENTKRIWWGDNEEVETDD